MGCGGLPLFPIRAVCIIFRLCGRLCVVCLNRAICVAFRLCGRLCVICPNRAICVVFRLCRRSCADRLGRASCLTRGLCRGLTVCRAGGFCFVFAVDQRFLHRGRNLCTFRGPCLEHCLGAGCLLLRFTPLHRPTGVLPLQFGNPHSFEGFPLLQFGSLCSPMRFLPGLGSRMPPCRAVCIIFRLCGRSCANRLGRTSYFTRGLCGGLTLCRAGGFCFVLAVNQRFLHRGRDLRAFRRQCLGHSIRAGCLLLRLGGLHRPMGFLLLQFGNLHSFVRFLILQFKGPHDPAGFLPSLDSRMPPCRAVCIIFRLCGRLLVGRPGRTICAGLRLYGRWCVICLNQAICVVFCRCRKSCAGRLGRMGCFAHGLCGSLMICRAGGFGFRFVLAVDQRFLHRGRGLRTFRRQCLGHCIGAGRLFLRFKALHQPVGFLPLQLGTTHSFVEFPLLQCRGLRSPVGVLLL